MTEEIFEKADAIMDQAVETAGELLSDKPRVAEVILKQLLKVDPEHLSGLQLLGLCKHRMGQNSEAVEIIQTALDLDPTCADNWNNIGLSYGGLDNYHRAIDCLEKAIELKPEQYLFLNNIALQYRHIGEHERAVEALEKALSLEEVPQVMINLGSVYGEMNDLEKSQKTFERAIEISPNYAAAHVDLAMNFFLQGEWKAGHNEYEWRFDYYPQMSHYKNAYDMNKRWNGKVPLKDKRILIYCEQGSGDAIQFVRNVSQLKDMGAYVMLHCAESLNAVLAPFVDQIINKNIVTGEGDEFPEYDYQCAIMSLPHLLDNIEISGKPYIKAPTDKFREHLAKEYGNSFNIGIAWAGSPAHPRDKSRSIPLKHFQPLQEVDNVQLFSLQMDVRKREYGLVHFPTKQDEQGKMTQLSNFQAEKNVVDYCEGCEDMNLVDLTSMIQNFEDTSTILAGLDLVICCDTALLHLAGAMGVPAWGVLAYNPDWRWEIEGDTSIWYDSVRLFRQTERDNWEEVFGRVKEALNEELLARKA